MKATIRVLLPVLIVGMAASASALARYPSGPWWVGAPDAPGGASEVFDPIPVESTSSAPALTGKEVKAQGTAVREVVMLSDKEAFAKVGLPTTPTLASSDPRGDWLRLGPKAPPEPGEVVETFPPKVTMPKPQSTVPPALAVVRHHPSGSEVVSDIISVSFNQPVGTLTTLEQRDAKPIPLEVTPALPMATGEWLGSSTAALRVPQRLPIATQFRATVPVGSHGAAGSAMSEAYSFEFSTPLPKITHSFPSNGSIIEPTDVFELHFNGMMDRASVLQKATLTGPGGAKLPLMLVEEDYQAEVEALRAKDPVAARELEIRRASAVRLKPKRPLKLNTAYRLFVDQGVLSSEGPLPGKASYSVSFRTYAPLKLLSVGCDWDEDGTGICHPGSSVIVQYNNALAAQPLKDKFSVTPKVDGLEVEPAGEQIYLSGDFRPGTTYTVTVKAGLTDEYGQKDTRGGKKQVKFGPAEPDLMLSAGGLAVLESGFEPFVTLHSVNVEKVTTRMYSVPWERTGDAVAAMRSYDYAEHGANKEFGLPLANSGVVRLKGNNNKWQTTRLDLQKVIGEGGSGAVLVEVFARIKIYGEWEQHREVVLAQVTNLGITTAYDSKQAWVMVARLDNGAPVAGATVAMMPVGGGPALGQATSDERGIAYLKYELPSDAKNNEYIFSATLDKDRVFDLVQMTGVMRAVSTYDYAAKRDLPRVSAMVVAERGAYRPGETVHMQAIARMSVPGPQGDLELVPEEHRSCDWTIMDPRRGKVAEGKAALSPFGTLWLKHLVEKNAPLGIYSVRFDCAGVKFGGSFNVQEFRTPEFKVGVVWETLQENILVYRKLAAEVSANYLFGAPMAGARVEWRLSRDAVSYTPPGNDGFAFGDINPESWSSPYNYRGIRRGYGRVFKSGDGVIDDAGVLRLELALEPEEKKPLANSFQLEADVIDENHQSISSRASVVAHWSERYVGVGLSKSLLRVGESVEVRSVVTRIDGERLEGEVTAILMRGTWTREEIDESGLSSARWVYKEDEVARCVMQAGVEAGKCALAPKEGGEHLVRVVTKDKKGRPARAAERLWVTGDGLPTGKGHMESLEMVLDKKEYLPGERALLLVRSPYPEARGLLVVAREGVSRFVPLEVKGGSALVELEVEENWGPSVHLEAVLFRGRTEGPEKAGDPGMPASATKRMVLPVSLVGRGLSVGIELSQTKVGPGDEVEVKVTTRDAQGRPVKANVALAVVDEGVLSLTGYQTPNPLLALYTGRQSGAGEMDSRRMVMPRDLDPPKVSYGRASGTGGAAATASATNGGIITMGSMGAKAPAKKAMRSKNGKSKGVQYEFDDFNIDGELTGPSFYVRALFASTAFFDGGLTTGEEGVVTQRVKMPDNLTQFRVMAIAADGRHKFGSGQASVTTRVPIMVRPSLPRFLNVGDTFMATALVTNVSEVDTQVKVKALAENLAVESDVRLIDLAAGETRSVAFKASAKAPGPATVRFAAVAMTKRPYTDAADVTIPTLLPATAEATATYGVVETAVGIPFQKPAKVLEGFGGLEVSLSSTALTGLQDALNYVVTYAFECAEQTASRLIAIVSLLDIIEAFEIGGLGSREKATEVLLAGAKQLSTFLRGDGGVGFWKNSDFSWLHSSAYVLYALDALADAGVGNHDYMIQQLQRFITKRLDILEKLPANSFGRWDPLYWEARALDSQAFAIAAMARSGAVRQVSRHMVRLVKVALEPTEQGVQKAALPVYACAWLTQALHVYDSKDERIGKFLAVFDGAAVETSSSFAFSEGSHESMKLMWHTSERTTALVVQTLLQVNPESPLLEKAIRGLVRARVNGRWSNTNANAFALMALNDYFRTFEKEVPEFVARIWAGEEGVLAREFKGRSMEIAKGLVPMKALLEMDGDSITVGKEGTGRLYYRLGLRYAPRSLKLESLDRGFLVERSYWTEDESGQLEEGADGALQVKAGSYVRVKLRITAPQTRYYVAVVDPLPAGLEAVNQAFVTSARSRQGSGTASRERWGGHWWSYWSPWNFTEMRDDRVQLFQDRMYGGVYEYTYLARATTPGTFVVPPTRAEEMYEPETFGRSATRILTVIE